MENVYEPKTLQDAILYFGNQDNCLKYLAAKRWPDGVVVCPTPSNKRLSGLPIMSTAISSCSNCVGPMAR